MTGLRLTDLPCVPTVHMHTALGVVRVGLSPGAFDKKTQSRRQLAHLSDFALYSQAGLGVMELHGLRKRGS